MRPPLSAGHQRTRAGGRKCVFSLRSRGRTRALISDLLDSTSELGLARRSAPPHRTASWPRRGGRQGSLAAETVLTTLHTAGDRVGPESGSRVQHQICRREAWFFLLTQVKNYRSAHLLARSQFISDPFPWKRMGLGRVGGERQSFRAKQGGRSKNGLRPGWQTPRVAREPRAPQATDTASPWF